MINEGMINSRFIALVSDDECWNSVIAHAFGRICII